MSNKGVCRTALATAGLVISCVVCFGFKAKLALFCNTYVKLHFFMQLIIHLGLYHFHCCQMRRLFATGL